MLDFSHLKKMIYFPPGYHRLTYPQIIFVIERWNADWKGNTDAEQLLEGKFAFYADRRCQPYSDELWAACEDLIARRKELDRVFENLMKKGVT